MYIIPIEISSRWLLLGQVWTVNSIVTDNGKRCAVLVCEADRDAVLHYPVAKLAETGEQIWSDPR